MRLSWGLYAFVLPISVEEPPVEINDKERYKYDVERYGQEKADEFAREGNYKFIYTNYVNGTVLKELNKPIEKELKKRLRLDEGNSVIEHSAKGKT